MGLIHAALSSLAMIAPIQSASNETITYTYDAKGRLIATTHSEGSNDGVATAYAYDKADNRTNVSVTAAAPPSGPPSVRLGSITPGSTINEGDSSGAR